MGCEAGHACPARWMWPRQAHYQLELQLRSAAPAVLRVSACSPPAHTSAVIPLAPPCRNIPVGAPGPSPLFFCPNPTLTSTLTLAPPVQLYLPDEGHPSYGILRTYVKDYNDTPTSQGAISFVDSGAAGGWRQWRLGEQMVRQGRVGEQMVQRLRGLPVPASMTGS